MEITPQENSIPFPAMVVDAQPETDPDTVNPAAPPTESEQETFADGVITLSKPATIKGKTVTELKLDFDRLTGDDLLNIEEQMLKTGVVAMKNAAFSSTYCLYIAARAAGVNIAEFKKLSFKDADAIVQATQGFMMRSGSKEPEQSDA